MIDGAQLTRDEAATKVPLWLLEGPWPSDEFMMGRIYQWASVEAHGQVRDFSPSGELLLQMTGCATLAADKYRNENCEYLVYQRRCILIPMSADHERDALTPCPAFGTYNPVAGVAQW